MIGIVCSIIFRAWRNNFKQNLCHRNESRNDRTDISI